MSELIRKIANDRGLTRRQWMMLSALGAASILFPLARCADADINDDLESLSNLTQMAKREGPLLVFRDFVTDADAEVKQHIKLQWRQRADLLTALKEKIRFNKQVRLSVEDIQVRLMFVPQRQTGAEAAYHRYCLDVTDFLFEMGQKENILVAVNSPEVAYPLMADETISAFLVHRLAKEYQAVCRFTEESGRSVKYKVSGAIFSNYLGAVDLTVEMLAQGQFGLSRCPFTIWQDTGGGISTLMAVPVEESLHYWLGTATDRQIADEMQENPPESLTEAKQLAQEWMAIEESVTGGLIEHVLDRYCATHHMNPPVSLIEEMRPAIASLPQYRYREKGIRIVGRLGFEETIAMYLENPACFRDQLFRSEEA